MTSASGTLSPLSSPFTDTLSKDLVALLQAGPPPIYDEMGLVIQRIQADCQALYTAIASQGKLSASLIPILPNTFRIEHAQQVVESFPRLLGKFDEALRKRHHTTLETRLRKLTTAIGYYETTKSNRDRQVSAALGGGVIALGVLPQKLTPLIQSITNSLKVSLMLLNFLKFLADQQFHFSYYLFSVKKMLIYKLDLLDQSQLLSI